MAFAKEEEEKRQSIPIQYKLCTRGTLSKKKIITGHGGGRGGKWTRLGAIRKISSTLGGEVSPRAKEEGESPSNDTASTGKRGGPGKTQE